MFTNVLKYRSLQYDKMDAVQVVWQLIECGLIDSIILMFIMKHCNSIYALI